MQAKNKVMHHAPLYLRDPGLVHLSTATANCSPQITMQQINVTGGQIVFHCSNEFNKGQSVRILSCGLGPRNSLLSKMCSLARKCDRPTSHSPREDFRVFHLMIKYAAHSSKNKRGRRISGCSCRHVICSRSLLATERTLKSVCNVLLNNSVSQPCCRSLRAR
jgi:hypothetical protein